MAYFSLHLLKVSSCDFDNNHHLFLRAGYTRLLCVLQRAAFVHFPDLQDFALSNVAAVDTRESLNKIFGNLR